jgi:hypothetical protein
VKLRLMGKRGRPAIGRGISGLPWNVRRGSSRRFPGPGEIELSAVENFVRAILYPIGGNVALSSVRAEPVSCRSVSAVESRHFLQGRPDSVAAGTRFSVLHSETLENLDSSLDASGYL